MVEELHKAQRTGCDLEAPQSTTTAALEPTIALLSVIAVWLLQLRDAARDPQLRDQPATAYVEEELVEVLSSWRYAESRPLTVREFYLALARLGGQQNRQQDKPPGWLVLWREWEKLHLLVLSGRAARAAVKNRRKTRSKKDP